MHPACKHPPESSSRPLPAELALWLKRSLAPGVTQPAAPLWPDDALAARNTVLRALAQRFYPCVPVTTQAERISRRADHFAAVNWLLDRDRTQMPALYRGTVEEYLWAAFKSGAPMPIGVRCVRRILIGVSAVDDGDVREA